MDNCTHRKAHVVGARISNLEDSQRFMADIQIKCADCGMPFRFLGLPAGCSTMEPMCSIAGEEARIPIEPLDMDGPVPPHILEHMKEHFPA